MAAQKPVIPSVTWAQRKDSVLVSIFVEEVRDMDVKLESNKLHFSGVGGEDKKTHYAVDLDLYSEIDPEASKYVSKGRLVDFLLKKKDASAPFWPRLLKGSTKPGWLKVDFERWRDEDDEAPEGGAGDDFDFSSMMQGMNMGGMGGMDMGGMGGMDMSGGDAAYDFDANNAGGDSDDEENPDDMPKLE